MRIEVEFSTSFKERFSSRRLSRKSCPASLNVPVTNALSSSTETKRGLYNRSSSDCLAGFLLLYLDPMENAPKMFVTEIGEAAAAKLAAELPDRGFTLITPQY